MDKVKIIYIVSYFYFPFNNARSNRWTSIAEELVRRGYEIRVISGWQPKLSSHEVINGVKIYRVGLKFLEKFRNKFQKKNSNLRDVNIEEGKSFSYYFGKAFLNLAWPDTTCFWIFSSILKILKLSKGQRIEVLISVSPTFSSVITGLIIRSRINKFILDIGDPFAFSSDAPANNFYLYSKLNRNVEAYACRTADYISVTNNKIANYYHDIYLISESKFFIIPPLFPSVKNLDNVDIVNNRFVYAGTFYKLLRRPDYILNLFSQLRIRYKLNLELYFIGDYSESKKLVDQFKEGNKSWFFTPGKISRDESHRLIKSAEFTINLGNKNPLQLPSKVVEYMFFDKPIINICISENDPSIEVLGDYMNSINLFMDSCQPSEANLAAAFSFIAKNNSQKLSNFLYDKSRFTLNNICDNYQNLIEI